MKPYNRIENRDGLYVVVYQVGATLRYMYLFEVDRRARPVHVASVIEREKERGRDGGCERRERECV